MFKRTPDYAAYLQLMRVHRPIGTFLLLWPTLWALWLAGKGQPEPTIVVIFILATIVMRAAGCVINDYADCNLDQHVQRTKNRPLTTGALTSTQALRLFILLIGIALVLVLQLNALTIYLSIIAALFTIIYPFAKRFTHLPQCVLGLAFSMSIPMAYAALTESLIFETWVLFAASVLWTIAYDTQYAMVDRDDDVLIGIKSTAILLGRFDNLAIGLLHSVAISLLAILGWMNQLTWHFYLALALAAGLATYQQSLCKDRIREKCLQAFVNNNWIGALVFLGIVLGLIQSNVLSQ